MSKKRVVLAGHCGVDAGLIMIGDPCYGQRDSQKGHPSNMDWSTFCDIIHHGKQHPMYKQLNFDLGHPGLGVVFDSGFGDGSYPVYVTIEDCGVWGERITKAEIFFDEDPHQPNDEEVA